MTRILAISDEVSDALDGDRMREIAPDLVVSCGDLPFDYLEYIVTIANVPLAYVLGNHDPDPSHARRPVAVGAPFGLRPPSMDDGFGPAGCTPVDGRLVEFKGLRVAGLGGCMRYSGGPHQYTEAEMRRRARRLSRRARRGRRGEARAVDVLITHAPPRGAGDEDDRAHRGFETFVELAQRLAPKVMLHGHIHPYGRPREDQRLGDVPVLNAVGYRVVDLPA